MDRRALRSVGLVLYVFLAFLPAVVVGWFLWIAQTWTGRGLAMVGLLLVWLPLLVDLRLRRGKRAGVWGGLALACGVTVVCIIAAILVTTPDGFATDDASAQSRFVGGAVHSSRYALTNVIPEIEQVNLGLTLIPYLDPFLDRRQALRLGSVILPAYREMEADSGFHRLGSAMGWAYAEVLGRPFDAGHYYIYVPRARTPGPLPAILFLHGSVGNFKIYTWAWSHLAEEHGYVIISPSFGFGNWYRMGGVQAAERALSDARAAVPLDEERIYLAGLSNGGTGVSRIAAEMPDQFRGLIYVSGVIEPSIVASDAFLEGWNGKPVLVIHGGADRRIPVSTARSATREMERGGVSISYIEYPNADHFLFLTRLDDVLNEVARWLEVELEV